MTRDIEATLTSTLGETLNEPSGLRRLDGAVSLAIYHRQGAELVPIAEGQALTVGRSSPPAELAVRDPSLSRAHARFSLLKGELWVEDLDSTNGTRVRGNKIRLERVHEGDDVLLGSVLVALHTIVPPAFRGLASYDRFYELLRQELTRARTFGRPLALVMVRSVGRRPGHLAHWAPRVKGQLREVDTMALYDANSALILFVESDLLAGTREAEAIVARRSPNEPPLVCGVVSFPERGASADELLEALRHATQQASERSPVFALSHGQVDPLPSDRPLFVSAAMRALQETAKRVAKAEIPVLITGETGTGKEVFAQILHRHSPRKRGPFRAISCAAIPETLLESTLFGHERGAFTGAHQQAKGIFEQASGGTVFLDEIGELSASAQASLLRVLEERQVLRIGGNRDQAVDVRIIAATHRDLEAMCAEGLFRLDLLYRLNTMVLELPPLAQRREEIEPLAAHFMALANKTNRRSVKRIDPGALALLSAYSWPGNLRELRNVIERAVVIAQDATICSADLPAALRREQRAPTPKASAGELPMKERLQRFEAELLLEALEENDWNQTKTAQALGVSLRSLVYKIKTFGLSKRYSRS